MKFNKIMDLSFLDAQTCNLIEQFESFQDHRELTERLKKTFYYGKLPSTPRPSLPLTEVTVELFSKAVPKVHLDVLDIHYAASISKKASLSPCSMMLALMYLERLRRKNPQYLQTVSSCDLFLVSVMVASKYLCDDEGSTFNDEWAESAGMELKDLNRLEKQFLSATDWELFVEPTAFFNFLVDLETRMAECEGSKRNWLTYTEMCILVQRLRSMQGALEDFSKVMLVSGIVYMSAVVTLLAATTLALKCCALIPYAIAPQQFLLPCSTPTFGLPSWPPEDRISLANSSAILCHPPSCYTPPPLSDDGTKRERFGVMEDALWRRNLDKWRTPSIWNTFKYWPTCCGGPNSAAFF